MDNKTLQLHNKYLPAFIKWLNEQELVGRLSRLRTRFIKLTRERLEEVEKGRIEILERVCKKDEEGKPITIGSGKTKSYDIALEDVAKFNEEFAKLGEEPFVLDVLAGHKEAIEAVAKIVLATELKISGTDAEWYDEVCSAFEAAGFTAPEAVPTKEK